MWDGTIDLKLMVDDTARAYRRAGFKVNTLPFTYNFREQDIPLANTNAPSDRLQISQEGFFIWCGLSISLRDLDHAGALNSWYAGVSMMITDESTGYRIMTVDPHTPNPPLLPHQFITGQDGAPYLFAFPYILPPGATLTCDIRHSGEVAQAMVSLVGCHLYTKPYSTRVIIPDVPGMEAV